MTALLVVWGIALFLFIVWVSMRAAAIADEAAEAERLRPLLDYAMRDVEATAALYERRHEDV